MAFDATLELDSSINKLRAQVVCELIRQRLAGDCTDSEDASGGHCAYMHIVPLFFIALEARGFDGEEYGRLRDAALSALDIDDRWGALREAARALNWPHEGAGAPF